MDYIIPAFSMLALDSLYLSNIGGPLFAKMVNKIQKEDMKLNVFGAIGSYILLILVLYKFIILEKKPPSDAFLLGFCIYGIFDLTNIAIFKNYQIIPALVDTVWGGVLFYSVTWITYKLLGVKY
jgi:uncharacterized membrane protein